MFNISLSGYDIYVAAQDEERAKDCNPHLCLYCADSVGHYVCFIIFKE